MCACPPARVSHLVIVALVESQRPVPRRKGRTFRPELRAPRRPAAKAFSGDIRRCCVERRTWCGTPNSERFGSARTAMLAIADQRVEVSLGDAESTCTAGWDRRSHACRCVWEPLADFSLHSRDAQVQALELTGQERRDDRRDNRLGCGASTDGGARYAWLFLVWSKAEDGASHDATTVPDRKGGRPRAGIRRHE